jgi:hypothetical protein
LRHLTLALIAGAALTLGATIAVAQTVNQDSAPLDRNNLHTIICKDYPPRTGSHLGPRVICLTNLEWQEVHRQARDGYMLEIKKSFTMGHT